jgi:sarcosine oxidase
VENLISRRELGKSAIAAAMGKTLTEKQKHCAVIGAGVFGAWSAYHLRRTGYGVTLLDAYGPANMRASSGGESRIIRASYGKDEIYTRMAVRSLFLWEEFFRGSDRSLFYKTGVLWIAKPDNQYANESRETLRKVNVKFEDLTSEELRKRYPQIQAEPGTGAIFEPNSGALMARAAVQTVVAQFVKDGGVYRHAAVRAPAGKGRLTRVITSEGESIEADSFVFACGAWLKSVLPDVLGRRIFPTRQEVFFFGVPPGDRRFEPPRMPVWIDFGDNRGMYGFPDLETRGFKVAFDLHGAAFDPDAGNRLPSPEKLNEARRYVAERFPALAKSPIVGSRVCQYENTSNGDFVIDRHPEFENVWIAGGGSGHGFKHGPAVGEYVTARVSGAAEPPVQPRFSIASKGTQQHRSVV